MARGLRVRGSRRPSGLIRGGEVCGTRKRVRQTNESASPALLHPHLLVSIHHILAIHRTVPGTTAWGTCEGGGGRTMGVL